MRPTSDAPPIASERPELAVRGERQVKGGEHEKPPFVEYVTGRWLTTLRKHSHWTTARGKLLIDALRCVVQNC